MSKTIKFSMHISEFKILSHEAKSRGLTNSQFVKMAVFAYISKYPSKGIFSELARDDKPCSL